MEILFTVSKSVSNKTVFSDRIWAQNTSPTANSSLKSQSFYNNSRFCFCYFLILPILGELACVCVW